MRLVALCAAQCGKTDARGADGAFVDGVAAVWGKETGGLGARDDAEGDAVFRGEACAVEELSFGEDGAVCGVRKGGDENEGG